MRSSTGGRTDTKRSCLHWPPSLCGSTPTCSCRARSAFAAKNRLPSIGGGSQFVGDGGLLSYGASFTDGWQLAARYVDKILKGAKPGDLPVEQPTKFELVINRKTARALGLTIPAELLLLADKVIE